MKRRLLNFLPGLSLLLDVAVCVLWVDPPDLSYVTPAGRHPGRRALTWQAAGADQRPSGAPLLRRCALGLPGADVVGRVLPVALAGAVSEGAGDCLRDFIRHALFVRPHPSPRALLVADVLEGGP